MAGLNSLKGVGEASLKELKRVGINTIDELLAYFPRDYEFREKKVPFGEAYRFGTTNIRVNTVCVVTGHQFFGQNRYRQTLKINVKDDTGTGTLICFGRNFLEKALPVGQKIFLSGVFNLKFGELQCSTFDYEYFSENPLSFGRILPVYPLSGKLTEKFLRKTIYQALEISGRYSQNRIPAKLMELNGLMNRSEALKNIHFPENREKLERAVRTLKYEELYLFQQNVREAVEKRKSRRKEKRTFPRNLQRKVASGLSFRLTDDQIEVIDRIYADSLGEECTARIVQGDVGCGKTIVGFLAALPYIEAGMQCAFIAPTELLAEQHIKNAARLLEGSGVRLGFMSGKLPAKKKELLLKALADGEIDLLIGTHALLSGNVIFRNLGFVIIDEQQRFGVIQRSSLIEKGKNIDYIMMSATPIPRSLEMAFFGELSISTIRTMPPGRKPVITYTVKEGNEGKIYDWVKKELKEGHQAYFVYPLIGDSDKLDLRNATEMYGILQNEVFRDYRCALIHSRMKDEEKESIMESFSRGETHILIATSVVEVGVDVKSATCMVIQHAERFGLSSLHQLRGRVGRSELQAYTFLVFSEELTDNAKERLRIMKETNDGFEIAERDLKLRGPGDIAGTEQSGFMNFRLADIFDDMELVKKIHSDLSMTGC